MSKHPFAKVSTRVVADYSMNVTEDFLLDALRRAGYQIPDHARVVVDIPSGGDCSGFDMDLGEDGAKLSIRWTLSSAKTEEVEVRK